MVSHCCEVSKKEGQPHPSKKDGTETDIQPGYKIHTIKLFFLVLELLIRFCTIGVI
jgi:hypothetical protein